MKKVLFFASDYKIGLSTLLTDEALAFYHAGIDFVTVAGDSEQEEGLSDKINELVSVYRIDNLDEHHNFKSLAKDIAQIAKSNGTNVFHVQNNWQLALSVYIKYVLLHNLNIKIVYTLHGFRHNHPLKSIIARILIGGLLFFFADQIICMSSYLKRKFALLSYKIVLIPLGIPDSFFTEKHEIDEGNGLQMVFPAQFRYGKNQNMIIRAFAKYIKKTGDTSSCLILPGSGDLQKEMISLTQSLGISRHTLFPGQCSKDKIRQYYLQCNIGIVASNCETFGQSIVEPFVLGRCVVTTPVGIAPDILKDGEGGLFFRNEDELTKIFERLHTSPSFITQCGKHNFERREQFRWASIAKLYKNMLSDL